MRDGVFESLITPKNVSDDSIGSMGEPPVINVTKISGDNYTDNVSNRSLGS